MTTQQFKIPSVDGNPDYQLDHVSEGTVIIPAIKGLIERANCEVLPLLKGLFTIEQLKYVCVAGGYTRNILLGFPVNDIDIWTIDAYAPQTFTKYTKMKDYFITKPKCNTYEYFDEDAMGGVIVTKGYHGSTPFDLIFMKGYKKDMPFPLYVASKFDSILSMGALVYNEDLDSLTFVCTSKFLQCLQEKKEILNVNLCRMPSRRITKFHRLYGIIESTFKDHLCEKLLRWKTTTARDKYMPGKRKPPFTMSMANYWTEDSFNRIYEITKGGNAIVTTYTVSPFPLEFRETSISITDALTYTSFSDVRGYCNTLSSSRHNSQIFSRFYPLPTGILTARSSSIIASNYTS